MKPERNPCKGCVYQGYAGSIPICEYILKTRHRRPCPPGQGCTVRTTEKGDAHMKQKTWDEARARALLAEGKTDLEVAEMVGASLGAIRAWKGRNGLTQKRGAKAKGEAVKPAAATSSTPPALLGLPVEVSFSYDGCTVSLTAPDMPRAVWGCRYLRQILDDVVAVGEREREREPGPEADRSGSVN